MEAIAEQAMEDEQEEEYPQPGAEVRAKMMATIAHLQQRVHEQSQQWLVSTVDYEDRALAVDLCVRKVVDRDDPVRGDEDAVEALGEEGAPSPPRDAWSLEKDEVLKDELFVLSGLGEQQTEGVFNYEINMDTSRKRAKGAYEAPPPVGVKIL